MLKIIYMYPFLLTVCLFAAQSLACKGAPEQVYASRTPIANFGGYNLEEIIVLPANDNKIGKITNFYSDGTVDITDPDTGTACGNISILELCKLNEVYPDVQRSTIELPPPPSIAPSAPEAWPTPALEDSQLSTGAYCSDDTCKACWSKPAAEIVCGHHIYCEGCLSRIKNKSCVTCGNTIELKHK